MPHRFFVEAPLAAGEIQLPPHIARQITTVLRMRPGDELILFNGTGGEWRAILTATGRTGASVDLVEQRDPQTEPALRLTLCQAMLKADKMEWVLQKGTEIGVHTFQPLLTQRTVAGGWSAAKLDRWNRIVVEAAEQSGRTSVPAILAPVSLPEALAQSSRSIFCWETEGNLPFARVASHMRATEPLSPLTLFVGPEGGFSHEEAALARAAGAHIVSLGTRILRSETAAIAACVLALLGTEPV
jgi:16S rRNA (uracil1498-N3)-methyltransferase